MTSRESNPYYTLLVVLYLVEVSVGIATVNN